MGRMTGPALLFAALTASLLPMRMSSADTAPEDLYVRTPQSVAEAASAVVGWAKARGVASVLVAFDVISFAPPPGANEFRTSRFARDLDAWTKAFAGAAKADAAGPQILLATTGDVDLAPAGDERAVVRLSGALRGTDWKAKRSPVAAAFDEWVARVLARAPPGKRALVLVAGLQPPENLDEGSAGPPLTDTWRRHLARPGDYWDEERVIAALVRSGASFAVVAPEARFCDCLPVDDLPQVPWASRPVVTAVTSESPVEPEDDAAGEDEVRRHLRELGLSDEAIERQIDERRRATAGVRALTVGGRFDWATPRFCDRVGSRVVANTDCPSGFGWWPYSRVAAATDGVYVRYPASGSPWLDTCPRDEQLMAVLAPSFGARREWASSRARDPAFGEMLAIVDTVKDRLPWPQDLGPTSGGVWCGFESSGGAASPDRRWRARDLPCESFPLTGEAARDWSREADRARAAAEQYAASADRLARLAERLAARSDARPSRTDANVRLLRFWCEMSAFHLDALALLFDGIPKIGGPAGRDAEVQVAYVAAIQMSDCLDAYDGRRITDDEERTLCERSDARLHAGAQSNFLVMLPGDPRVRARRSFDAVTRNLDPRLLPRARRMVAAAQSVMDRYAKSPWGWVVYYASAATFVHEMRTGRSAPGDVGAPAPVPPDSTPPDSDPGGPRTPK